MTVRKEILGVLVIVNLVLQTIVSAEVRKVSQEQIFKNGDFIKDVNSLTSPGQVYGSCYDTRTHDNIFEAHCSFVIETKKAIDSPNHQQICNFTLNSNVDSETDDYHIQSLTSIDKNKVVLTWQSSNTFKLFVLHFSECQAFPVKMDFQAKNVTIHAPFDDVFDIMVSEADNLCDVKTLCKLTADTRGNIVSEAENWPGQFDELLAMTHSPTQGRIMIDVHPTLLGTTVVRIYMAKEYRLVTYLEEHPVDEVDAMKDRKKLATSSTHELLSVCLAQKENILCAQFNSDGKRKFEKTFSTDKNIIDFDVHNLPNGGFLLLVHECDKDNTETCDDGGSFYVKKFNPDGEFVGSILTDAFDKTNVKHLHFFENEIIEMCLSHVQRQWVGSDKATLDIICFTDEDFLP